MFLIGGGGRRGGGGTSNVLSSVCVSVCVDMLLVNSELHVKVIVVLLSDI